jgi:nitrogen PTS system EIIA component
MLLSEILTPSQVIVSTDEALDKRGALRMLSGALATAGKLSPSDVERVLLERESVQSTGVGEGVAIPHGAIPELNAQFAALLILANGVEFEAIDDEKVQILFAVIGPKRTSGEHLKILARISRLLRNPSFRSRLLASSNGAQAYAHIASEEAQ